MSLKKNTIANYIGLAYVTIIGIVMLPFYLRYLGAEAYGLVGFYAVMQSWLSLLDMGMSPTLARQVAHERGRDSEGYLNIRSLLRSIELIFIVMSVTIALGIGFASHWIAASWLKVQALPVSEVAYCITLMGIIVGFRWFASLYRSGIQGMEHQVWLNGVNIALATLRYIVVLGLLRWVSQEPRHFFEYQLAISIVELGVLSHGFYSRLPARGEQTVRFSWSEVRSVLPFMGGIAYTSTVWVLLTQSDKLILSHVLPLKEYGYFALVAVMANGILQFSGPIGQAIQPRMTVLLSQGNEAAMLALYRKATQFVVALMMSLAGVVALFSTELIYAWTGDKSAADWAGPVLIWFVLGNGILAISAFQYYLQFAHGKLKLHVVNSTLSALIQVPIVIYVAFQYGARGVAISWFVIRALMFFIWLPIVHHRLAPGIHRKWLMEDIAPFFLMTCATLAVANSLRVFLDSAARLETVSILLGIGILVLLANFLVSGVCRAQIMKTLKWGQVK